MNEQPRISVEGISKKFCRSVRQSLKYGITDSFKYVLGNTNHDKCTVEKEIILRPNEFLALDNISFNLFKGEALGIVGSNGAGKTTLLRIINKLIYPDKGRVTINGRVSALIALGTGFNPILTGRENIFINGSVLGMSSREIKSKLEEIISFSGLEDSIDMPVQSYSSGMQVRLGFAVATAITPDILIADEILAVGDREFKDKCYSRIQKCKDDGATILFVSHAEESVRFLCDKCLYLKSGIPIMLDTPDRVFRAYNNNTVTAQTPTYYTSLVKGGVRIFEYKSSYLSACQLDNEVVFKSAILSFFPQAISPNATPKLKLSCVLASRSLSPELQLHFKIKQTIKTLIYISPIVTNDSFSDEEQSVTLYIDQLWLGHGTYECKFWVTRCREGTCSSLPISTSLSVILPVDQPSDCLGVSFGVFNPPYRIARD
mgnify:CR=1 FL=1